MNRKLIQIIDKILILSIYLVSVFDFSEIIKILFIFSFIPYSILLLNNIRFSKLATLFVLIVSATFSFLLLNSLLRGNMLDVAMKFIIPLFTLLNIFIYAALSKEYRLDRYIYHYYIVSILISLKILMLLFLFTNNIFYDYLPIADPNLSQPTWIAAGADGIRIFVGQATLIPVGLLFSYYLYGKMPYAFLLVSLFALALTQTTVLWVSYLLVLGYLLHNHFKLVLRYIYSFLIMVIVVVIGFYNYDLLSSVYADKITNSAPVKFQQIDIALSALENNFFFGGGLGHLYSDGSNAIEVAFLQILSTTGVVGFIIYGFMLFFWSVVSFKFVKVDKMTKVLFLAYLSIVFASFSNPYLIGGNSGLFLIPIIAARFLQLRSASIKNYATSSGAADAKSRGRPKGLGIAS